MIQDEQSQTLINIIHWHPNPTPWQPGSNVLCRWNRSSMCVARVVEPGIPISQEHITDLSLIPQTSCPNAPCMKWLSTYTLIDKCRNTYCKWICGMCTPTPLGAAWPLQLKNSSQFGSSPHVGEKNKPSIRKAINGKRTWIVFIGSTRSRNKSHLVGGFNPSEKY